MLSKELIEAAHRAVRDERQRQQETLAEFTTEREWAAALARINDRQRATLNSWARAVAAIPQTGKSVFVKRAHAQRLLGVCLSSIPAWVVSLSRLHETIEPVPGLLDVAIVDEASQCWIDSLVLFYLPHATAHRALGRRSMLRRTRNRQLVAAVLVRRPRRTEARPLVDLSDFQSAKLSDFRPALRIRGILANVRITAGSVGSS
jgi:hypothetical protein